MSFDMTKEELDQILEQISQYGQRLEEVAEKENKGYGDMKITIEFQDDTDSQALKDFMNASKYRQALEIIELLAAKGDLDQIQQILDKLKLTGILEE